VSALEVHPSELMGEIERLQTENWQLKQACGYPIPADKETINNPFKCGMCDARSQGANATLPIHLDKRRLLADRLRWIYQQKDINLKLAAEVCNKLEEIIFHLDAGSCTPPVSEALRPSAEVVAAVQEAIQKHPHWKPGLGSSAFAFGLANTAIDAYRVALSREESRDGFGNRLCPKCKLPHSITAGCPISALPSTESAKP
jgi:hypothetical protein